MGVDTGEWGRGARRLLAGAFTAVALAGCSLGEIQRQSELTETLGMIHGKVERATAQEGHLIVNLYQKEDELFTLVDTIKALPDGSYTFPVLPGEYYIAAYVDNDNDGRYQPGEHANYLGKPTAISVAAQKRSEAPVLSISGRLPERPTDQRAKEAIGLSTQNIGRLAALSDARFSEEYESMGLWRPVDFLEQVGAGLFLLQPYEKNKIPVIFVHGINGGPNDWTRAIEALDREHFQPWVFYYPSGVRLDLVSDYFAEAVYELHTRYQPRQFYVLAHSMGGLVTRSFVMKYHTRYPKVANRLRLVMTVNSPLDGMTSAVRGIEYSPIVIPSWRDVAAGSEFIQNIQAWDWPKGLPYHLVFSFKGGAGDDGVVPIKSQLPMKLQDEAVRIYGFNHAHAAILGEQDFITRLNAILAQSIQR